MPLAPRASRPAPDQLVITASPLQPGPDGATVQLTVQGVLVIETADQFRDATRPLLQAGAVHFRLALDGRTHELPRNDRGNCLHGGSRGFDKRMWSCVRADESSLTLGYASPDREMGFPGTLAVEVTYAVRASDLHVSFRATTDAPTVVNLTNHTCWNLAGAGDVREHVLRLDASTFTPLDDTGIPTGETATVAASPVDFRDPRPLGDSDLDHNVVLDRETGLRRAASLAHPASGRTLEVWTTEPCLQVWTGGTLHPPYDPGSGIALETQHAPDSPNRPGFPSVVLRPGDVFESTTVFRF